MALEVEVCDVATPVEAEHLADGKFEVPVKGGDAATAGEEEEEVE